MIIGCTGPAQVGKDSVGKVLVDLYGYTRVAFADKMKAALYALNPWITPRDVKSGVEFKQFPTGTWKLQAIVDDVGWDRAKMLPEVRGLLQRLGTEVGRDVLGEDIWVEAAWKALDVPLYAARVVVTDVRFENEARWVREHGGQVVHVSRPGYGAWNGHKSEAGVVREPMDWEVANDGGLGDLRSKVEGLMAAMARTI